MSTNSSSEFTGSLLPVQETVKLPDAVESSTTLFGWINISHPTTESKIATISNYVFDLINST